MSASELYLMVLAAIVACIAYWLGHSDGYWARAEEDNRDAIEAAGKPPA